MKPSSSQPDWRRPSVEDDPFETDVSCPTQPFSYYSQLNQGATQIEFQNMKILRKLQNIMSAQ